MLIAVSATVHCMLMLAAYYLDCKRVTSDRDMLPLLEISLDFLFLALLTSGGFGLLSECGQSYTSLTGVSNPVCSTDAQSLLVTSSSTVGVAAWSSLLAALILLPLLRLDYSACKSSPLGGSEISELSEVR